MADSFWKTESKKVPEGIKSHPWMGLLRDTTALVKPEMYVDLEESGELEDYLRVKVSEALEEYDRLISEGSSEEAAKEAVFETLFPEESDDDEIEDWEVDEAEKEHTAALMKSLGVDMDDIEMDEDDEEEDEDEPDEEDDMMMMSLKPGQRKTVNGVEYVLNENHRWTLPGQSGAQPATKPASPQLVKQMPGAVPQRGNQPPSMRAPAAPIQAMPGAAKPVQQGLFKDSPAPKQPFKSPSMEVETTGGKQKSLFDTKGNPDQMDLFGGDGIPDELTYKPTFDPHVDADPNRDGVTDAARVGVPAFEVPPPPKKITRIPGLTGVAKKAEDSFVTAFEKDPERLTDDAIVLFTAHANGKAATFETDACKKLSMYWHSAALEQDIETRAKNRATLNTALHQTANAICKRAFVKHLDTLPEGSEILVTVGGCGAGKGYALKNVPQALEMKERAAVVWDSAGDQNATENPWILQEARKRKLKVNYVFVAADPKVQWADPGRGVVKRAQDPNDGRMVDAMVFADSYAIGAKNHHAFAQKHQHDPDVKCVYLQNGAQPKLLSEMPKEMLEVDRRELAKFAVDYVNSNPDIPDHIREGALGGQRIWKD